MICELQILLSLIGNNPIIFMKSNEIADILLKEYYPKGRQFCSTNFSACGLQECDVIMVTKSMMIYEYEIKCSYGDFKADFKKAYKHKMLKGEYNYDEKYLQQTGTAGRPNYFTYVCKKGLIPVEEVPAYAGLIYINEDSSITVIKKTPKLHKHPCDQRVIFQLCRSLTARMIYGSSYMNWKRII